LWSPGGQAILLAGDHDLWLYTRASKTLERLTKNEADEEHPSFAPDGKHVAFVRENDLYVLDLATKKETRLTQDGSETVHNGNLDWVYEEEIANRMGRSYEWSPDSSAIAFIRLDETRVHQTPIVDYLAVPAAVKMQRYPKAGAQNAIPAFRVVRLDGTPAGAVAFDPDDVYLVPHFSWTLDSKAVCYRVMNRAQNHQDVHLYYPAENRSKPLFAENDPFWLNAVDPPRFFANGRYLWLSERDGFRHLYAGDIAGGPLKQITRGAWMVDAIAGVDEKKGLVYFSASEEHVRRRQLYRVGLDGKGFKKLTTAKGTHQGVLSPDGHWLLDNFSNVATPPVRSLLDTAGKLLRVVDRPENELTDYELATTEEVEVLADDGEKLFARLTKPAAFDPGKKYPVIVSVYGGPHAQVVRDAWGAVSLMDHLYAGKGWLVWSLDNRGSSGRGHAFETPVYKDMGKHELVDQLTGVKYLKSLPYVDGSRIGMTGWSYGGYMTLFSLTNAPDIWKCGVAGAPVTHWKFYDTIYTERYMSTPQANPKGYETSAPLTKAKDLKAPVLILHGAADDNVHIQNTMSFIDALTKAGRPYQLQIQPGQKHGFRGKAFQDFRNAASVKFFEENL
jgi:dipeptidyl-peptidase-4